MALDPRIILQGQAPDVLGAMGRGNALAQQTNQMRQQQQQNAFLQDNSQALLSGDQNALAQYAQYDPTGAFNMQTQNRNNARADEQLAFERERLGVQDQRADQEWQMRVEEYRRGLSAEQAAAEATQIEDAVKMGLSAQTPEQWDAMMAQQAPDLVGQFENRDALANRYMDVAAILKGQNPAPLSSAGKTQADINAGLLPQGTPLRGSGVTVNTGDGSPGLGKLSSDYGYVLDPVTGQPVIDPETGLPQAAPVPGSPAAREIEQAQEQGASKQETSARSSQIVLDSIKLARDQAEGFGTTGFLGNLTSRVPGSGSHDLANTLNTVKANIGFDRLQQMRDESPTGGALGAINNQEMVLLQSVLGSVEQSQSQEQLDRNLARLEEVYTGIMRKASAYPNASQFGFDGEMSEQPSQQSGQRLRFNPETGDFE